MTYKKLRDASANPNGKWLVERSSDEKQAVVKSTWLTPSVKGGDTFVARSNTKAIRLEDMTDWITQTEMEGTG